MTSHQHQLKLLEPLLTFLSALENIVIWIKDPLNNKQLFINSAYEKIWQRSCDSLIIYPDSFRESLLLEDEVINIKQFQERFDNPSVNTVSYRIHRQDGKIICLKDTCYKIIDSNGKHIMDAGITEVISEDEWQNHIEGKIKLTGNATSLEQFSKILISSLLIPQTNNESQSRDNSSVHIPNSLNIEGEVINLTSREHECLQYLYNGYSTKKISNELGIAVKTTEKHMESLRKKFSCRNKIGVLLKLNKANLG